MNIVGFYDRFWGLFLINACEGICRVISIDSTDKLTRESLGIQNVLFKNKAQIT